LIANFVGNKIAPVAGTYRGLFFDPDPDRFRAENSGSAVLQVNRMGGFSGSVLLGGVNHAVSGHFDPAGKGQASFLRGMVPVALSLTLDLSESGNTIEGSVTTTSDANLLTSPLLAVRNVFNARSNPAPQKGQQAFVLQQVTDSGTAVQATGTAGIGADGNVIINGQLADRGPFSRSSALSSDGRAPLYLSFAHNTEVFIGWLEFGDGGATSIGGQILHASPASPVVDVLEVVAP
jgi:hypothetical protein